MAANETVVPTESEKTSSYKYMKKRAVGLKIKCRIKEFKALMKSTKPGEGRLWSEDVSSELAPRAVWKLSVDPNGWEEESWGHITVALFLTGPMKDSKENLDATCHLYLVDGSGGSKIEVLGRRARNFGKGHYGKGGNASHDRVRKALQADGSLLVAADFEFLPPVDSALHVDLLQWPTKFSQFYGDASTSDCSIEIGGVTIPAHKLPLMACSPAFQEMFTNPAMEESESGEVKITDFQRPEPMRALIRYCYQGHLDDATMDGDGAVEIFKLADKYLIDDLKAHMEKYFIRKRLCVENVIEMAVLADAHSAVKLKKDCIKLIAEKWDAVSESAKWKKLEEEMPELAAELAAELAKAATAEE